MQYIQQKMDLGFVIPSMPTINTLRCNVRFISYITAKSIIQENHYTHRVAGSVMIAIGLYVDDVLAGCITYGKSACRSAFLCCGEKYEKNVLELNRLFVFDWCGRNTESYFIGQSFKMLRQYYPDVLVLISYTDERYNHLGTIYQATNWLYTGTGDPAGSPECIYLNGVRYHTRGIYRKYGTRDRKKLAAMGFDVVVVDRMPHHRYVCFLGTKKQQKELRKALKWEIFPYPKERIVQ